MNLRALVIVGSPSEAVVMLSGSKWLSESKLTGQLRGRAISARAVRPAGAASFAVGCDCGLIDAGADGSIVVGTVGWEKVLSGDIVD
jgi:hypothetical protein